MIQFGPVDFVVEYPARTSCVDAFAHSVDSVILGDVIVLSKVTDQKVEGSQSLFRRMLIHEVSHECDTRNVAIPSEENSAKIIGCKQQ